MTDHPLNAKFSWNAKKQMLKSCCEESSKSHINEYQYRRFNEAMVTKITRKELINQLTIYISLVDGKHRDRFGEGKSHGWTVVPQWMIPPWFLKGITTVISVRLWSFIARNKAKRTKVHYFCISSLLNGNLISPKPLLFWKKTLCGQSWRVVFLLFVGQLFLKPTEVKDDQKGS